MVSRMIVLSIFLVLLFYSGTAAKVYLLKEETVNDGRNDDRFRDTATMLLTRLKRQTHPGATIAKLSTSDTNAFIPIIGPTQNLHAQPSTLFQNTESFPNTLEFQNNGRNTPIDYLIPPNPDSQITSLNFQDPAANLQNIDTFDITSPSSSSTNNFASFQTFPRSFPASTQTNFQNQINTPQLSTTQAAITNDQSISFQNAPLAPLPTPSLIQSPTLPSFSNQFLLANKISNSNKEGPLLTNQFPIIPSQFANPTNPVTKLESQPERSNQARWELGYDANEILAPPREDSFGRTNEYDTINVQKFRRLNHISNNPLSPSSQQNSQPVNNNQVPPTINHFAAPNQVPVSNQQPLPQSQPPFSNFNSFPSNNFVNTPNDQFTPITNNHFVPASNQITNNQLLHDNTNGNPNNIIWGTQKQQQPNLNFAATTNAPFLPTVPPINSHNHNQPNNANFQNSGPPSSFNGISSQQQQPQQQAPFQQTPPNNQLYHLQNVNLNQNFALETPLTSQFDSFLPQGTVSDHTFPQHFRKRQANSEEDRDVDEQDEEPESKYKHRPGPVYSFVKTDRDGHFKWSVRHPSKR